MPTFHSVAVSIGIGRATKNKEARTGMPMVPLLCLATSLPKPKNKEAEKQRGHLVNCFPLDLQHVALLQPGMIPGTKNNKQRRADTDGLIDGLSLQSRQTEEKPKQDKKGKAANANLSFGCHVNRYQPSNKKQRSKDRDTDGSKPTCQKPKNKEAEKQRGRLVNHSLLNLWHVMLLQPQMTPKTTNKEVPMPMLQLMDHLFGWDEQRKSQNKVKKGKAANANLSFGCHVDQYWPSNKNQRSKDRDTDGFEPTC